MSDEMKIGFLSDLHIVHNTNSIEQAVNSVVEVYNNAKLDKLIIAGDITESANASLEFIDILVERDLDVYTIFGNHEYWGYTYEETQALNHDRYIHGKAININNNTIVIGIDGFFDYSLVLDVDNKYTRCLPRDKSVLNIGGRRDFNLDKNKIGNYSEVFHKMESTLINILEVNKNKDIILVTHYVPSDDFIIYNSDKTWTMNNCFMGSNRYREIAEEYGVDKVIFGHTHNQYNKTINGVDYHCNPVGYSNHEYQGLFIHRLADTLKVFDI